MTIAAVYRYDDNAIFISDFRVTHKNNLHDNCIKFESFKEKNIGLFMAGDIGSWKYLITEIRNIMGSITYENILDLDNDESFIKTLCSHITACPREYTEKKVGAIGFILDTEHNRNKVFTIIGRMGCSIERLEEVANNEFIIMGSAENVPNIRENAKCILTEENKNRFKDNAFQFANALRANIKESFKEAGTNSYEKLGVSPVMAIATLERSYFCIPGEDINEEQFNYEGRKNKEYSFTRNNNNEVVLKAGNKEIILNTTYNMGNYTDHDEVFWNGFQSYDPSSEYGENGFCYHLHQWYIPEYETLYRILYKINFIGVKKLCNKEEIAKNINEKVKPDKNYKEQVNICFIPINESKKDFIEDMNDDMILDDTILMDILEKSKFNMLFES